MTKCMADLLKSRRESMGVNLNELARASDLDRAALKRAEAGERIPALGFWIDWADSLGTSFEEIAAQARKKVRKKAGVPPERRRLGGE